MTKINLLQTYLSTTAVPPSQIRDVLAAFDEAFSDAPMARSVTGAKAKIETDAEFESTGGRKPVSEMANLPDASNPAVPVGESVKDDSLVCLFDGKTVKMLGVHLKRKYDMTPEQYRTRFNLPGDYPMIPAKSAARFKVRGQHLALTRLAKLKKPVPKAAKAKAAKQATA